MLLFFCELYYSYMINSDIWGWRDGDGGKIGLSIKLLG